MAFLHAGFLLVAVIGLLTVWRFNEDVRHRLRALLNGSGDAILEIDRNGDVVGWNPAAQATLGYAPEETSAARPPCWRRPGARKSWPRWWRAPWAASRSSARDHLGPQRREARGRWRSPSRPISDAGRAIGASIIVHDMGERLALQEAEERFRDFVERVPAVTYVAEPGADGALAHVSPRIEVMLGYTPEEWLADPLLWARRIHSGRPRARGGGGGALPGHARALRLRVPDGGP